MPARQVKSNLRQIMITHDKNIRAELRAEAQKTARDMAKWLGVAVANWSKKPRFVGRVRLMPTEILAFVDIAGTAKKIFVYIDQGTGLYGKRKKAYQIPKVIQPGKLLRFRGGYTPKTAPTAKGVNIGGSGAKSGGWISKVKIIHPGIKPRKFTEVVAKELKPDFQTRIENAIRRGASRQT